MQYKLTKGWPLHIESGEFINPDANVEYLAWLAAGNTPLPADLPGHAAIQQQITELEATVTQRRLREAALGNDGGWLADMDAQIAALRAQL